MITKPYLLEKIKRSNHTVAFTGSDISIASDIPRVYKKYFGYTLDEILNINFFNSNLKIFYKAFTELLKQQSYQPNIIHYTLSRLGLPIITENIDGLHQKAGSTKVIELHGNLNYLKCISCNYRVPTDLLLENKILQIQFESKISCPYCGKLLRPNLVLFGEPINNFNTALNEIDMADLVLVIGSNLTLWPANRLIPRAISENCEVIYINDNLKHLSSSIYK